MAKKDTADEAVTERKLPVAAQWDTTVKLGSIEEAKYAEVGAIVVAVNTASGELTLRTVAEKQPHGRSQEKL